MRKYGNYFVEEEKKIKDMYRYTKPKIIFWNCRIENFKIEKGIDAEEYIFINCRFPQQIQFQNFEGSINFTFIHCLIDKMQVVDVFLPGLKFICCEIKDSTLERSTLPGMVFGSFLERLPEKVEKYVRKKIPGLSEVCFIKNSSFLFCEMNNMIVDNVQVFRTGFKHCSLEALRICDGSEFIDVDLRGTKILNSDLGKCKFKKIRFNRGRSLVKLFLSIRKLFFKFRYSKDDASEERKRKKIDNAFTEFIRLKKIAFYQKGWKRSVDFLSSTDLIDIGFENADYTDAYRFFWRIQELDFIHNFRKERNLLGRIFSYITTSFTGSYIALAWRVVVVILLFTFLYEFVCKFGVDLVEVRGDMSDLLDGVGTPKNPLFLSIKVFLNSDISPLQPSNIFTEIMTISESISGYFVLALLAGKATNELHQRTSFPKRNRNES